MKNIIKNAAIIILVITSLAQTGRLWFGVTANRGFFYAFRLFLSNAPDDYTQRAYLTSPYRIISKTAAGNFNIAYSDLETNALKRGADAVLLELFASGKFLSEMELNRAGILGQDCVIYDYCFAIPSSIFAECFLQDQKTVKSKGARLTDNVKAVNRIVFIRPLSPSGDITVFIIDEGRAKAYVYSVNLKNKKSIADNPLLPAEESAPGALNYTALTENSFIPASSEVIHERVFAVNPYISTDGVRTLKSVESGIKALFGDMAINLTVPDDMNFKYANESTVVRYNLTTDTIEYLNYSSVNRQSDNGMAPNFACAVRFINNDPNIINDFYPASYSFIDDVYTFSFNYAIADLPVFLTETYKQDTGMNYAIELTIQNQKILKYKRIAHVFALDNEGYDTFSFSGTQDDTEAFELGYRYGGDLKLAIGGR